MVRILESKSIQTDLMYIEAAGLSTDEKPTSKVATGSTFLEVDTGDVFAFDEASQTWIEIGGDES